MSWFRSLLSLCRLLLRAAVAAHLFELLGDGVHPDELREARLVPRLCAQELQITRKIDLYRPKRDLLTVAHLDALCDARRAAALRSASVCRPL